MFAFVSTQGSKSLADRSQKFRSFLHKTGRSNANADKDVE